MVALLPARLTFESLRASAFWRQYLLTQRPGIVLVDTKASSKTSVFVSLIACLCSLDLSLSIRHFISSPADGRRSGLYCKED